MTGGVINVSSTTFGGRVGRGAKTFGGKVGIGGSGSIGSLSASGSSVGIVGGFGTASGSTAGSLQTPSIFFFGGLHGGSGTINKDIWSKFIITLDYQKYMAPKITDRYLENHSHWKAPGGGRGTHLKSKMDVK